MVQVLFSVSSPFEINKMRRSILLPIVKPIDNRLIVLS